MKTHTPGPWNTRDCHDTVEHTKNPIFAVHGPQGDCVAVCKGVVAPNEVNARLIAAAPEMAEVLQAVVEWASGEKDSDFHLDAARLLAQIRGAR